MPEYVYYVCMYMSIIRCYQSIRQNLKALIWDSFTVRLQQPKTYTYYINTTTHIKKAYLCTKESIRTSILCMYTWVYMGSCTCVYVHGHVDWVIFIRTWYVYLTIHRFVYPWMNTLTEPHTDVPQYLQEPQLHAEQTSSPPLDWSTSCTAACPSTAVPAWEWRELGARNRLLRHTWVSRRMRLRLCGRMSLCAWSVVCVCVCMYVYVCMLHIRE
jgi:hypothetical protein